MPELERLMGELGQPPFRAKQLKSHLIAGELSFDAMSNLPAILRKELSRRFLADPAGGRGGGGERGRRYSQVAAARRRRDHDRIGTDALRRFWAGARAPDRLRLDPGRLRSRVHVLRHRRLGLDRNLSASEIVAQVLHAMALVRGSDLAAEVPPGQRPITNLVFMGMGEPFANYNNVAAAIRTIMEPDGLGLGSRHITVSTVGIVPGIRRFTEEDWQVGLAVSLTRRTTRYVAGSCR